MNINHRVAKFLSSQQMEESETLKRTMNLGKALAKQLNLDPGVDTLARWMAHFISEQIQLAENSTGVVKKEAEEHCFEMILKLWKHKSAFPKGRRPFESFEPILRVLERLDPENDRNFFFEDRRSTSDNIPEEVKKWLDVADGIDEAARVWLAYVFNQAALNASDETTANWLSNSVDLQDNEGNSNIIRELISDAEFKKSAQELEQIHREKITSSINKLETFAELNQSLLTEYKKELEKYS